MQRILIFGSTAPSGIPLVRYALQNYPEAKLVLYVRSPQKLPADIASHPSIVLTEGQLDDTTAIDRALNGVDAVLSALGPSSPKHPKDKTPIADFYAALLGLMRKRGVKRIVLLGTASARDPRDRFAIGFKAMTASVYTLYYPGFNEFRAIGQVFRSEAAKGIEWTMVRVPFLTDGESDACVAG
ncbi:hypothetical protein BD626DRAFT_416038 [Schizophyllum amplum]|uniref:NAD(P)-binding domain-containing protein n=1 Tax=Schizophyllum amplum TaxID=97359 RepID=A0A550BSU8_9AGAR|nr:hypothetical protein BD626DRAFT_416038 [Auriculariopsis ampla]